MKKNITQINDPKDFHDHLDECEQCRNNPMSLCPEGELILIKVTKGRVDVEDIQRYARRVWWNTFVSEQQTKMDEIAKEILGGHKELVQIVEAMELFKGQK